MKRHKKCKGLLWGFLCAVWGFVCLFPIWVLFSGTFSNDSDNLTQVVFPTSFSNGVKKITEAISTIEIGRGYDRYHDLYHCHGYRDINYQLPGSL